MEGPKLGGIIAYPVTPFRRSDDAVDEDKLRALIERLVASGAHGIAPLGSAGESAYLSDTEWCQVAETSLDAGRRRVPMVVGVSDLTTQGSVRRARFAERSGADVVMVLPVSYWKLSEREIVRHYGTIAEAIDIPVMVYNNPATSGIDMPPELLVRLATEIDNVTMVKESSGDVQRMHRLHELTDGRLPYFNGSNPLALEAFAAGAAGWCTAAPCLFPAEILAFYEAVRAGDLADARKRFYRLLPPLRFLLAGGLPTTVKAGLALQGLDVGEPRRPLLPLDESAVRQLKELLAQL
ncbi:dihydrodipicolinate synthase family protein [Streptomyces lasiicapitis]|uniref:Dihydrodipicolinate synthase family protein n=1 Tax=Streptomyces lasiicapitis TaxID=1923961 RepID=A0ABQ2LIM6_9ACTN|nr:dihydrodipicolinate synthase family protein [Streptomyces lasiicapitis]GGO35486.1 dihydrodipicolinate synthase family protein [Streptomyces lasiicapitis]